LFGILIEHNEINFEINEKVLEKEQKKRVVKRRRKNNKKIANDEAISKRNRILELFI